MFNLTNVKGMINSEVDVFKKRYKIIGLYDNSNGLYFILYNGKQSILYNTASSALELLPDNKLDDITTEKFLEKQLKDFEECSIEYKENILYLKNHFDNSFHLTYIYTKDNLFCFNRKLDIDYKNDEFTFDNDLYNIHLSHRVYHYLVRDIKKEFVKLYEQFMLKKLTGEQLKQFMEDFVFSYSKDEEEK